MAIKTVFVGSNWEALEVLETLFNDENFHIEGIVTKPNKPVGRKQEIKNTPINEFAQKNSIPTIHPEKQEQLYQQALDLFKPELIVCTAFGEIIPTFFLEYPKYKAINIHFSLLPKYRGAIPIQKAILNGDKETGITFLIMVEKLDAGPMIAQFKEPIREYDTNETLRQRLINRTKQVLIPVLNNWVEGKIKPVPQNESQATYCYQKEISKERAQIDWENMDPQYIERMIRAFVPWPVAWTYINDVRIKIYQAQLINAQSSGIELKPGEARGINKRLFVGTKDPHLFMQILELQPEGGKRMTGETYLNGRDI